jgi:hypothetical protein
MAVCRTSLIKTRAKRYKKKRLFTYSVRSSALSNTFMGKVLFIEISNLATFSSKKRAAARSGRYQISGHLSKMIRS